MIIRLAWILALSLGAFLVSAADNQPVTLTLKQSHGFQYAGYYAAQWQGFYEESGLDVELLHAKQAEKIDNNLGSGFIVGGLDLLANDKLINELVVLAPIFQRSPYTIFSLSQTQIDDINQLSRLRLAIGNNLSAKLELQALFKSHGFQPSDISLTSEPASVETLLSGKADAIVTYEVIARSQAKNQEIILNRLYPADFGLDFYGDTLFTTREFQQHNPQLVDKFVEASLRGWHYALNNKQAMAEAYNQHFVINHKAQVSASDTLVFARTINALIQYPQTPIGHISNERWLNMSERLRQMGFTSHTLSEDSFYQQEFTAPQDFDLRLKFFVSVLILLSVVFIFWYLRKLAPTVFCIFMLTWILLHQIESVMRQENVQLSQLSKYRQLNSISARLEGDLKTSLALLRSIAAYISASPDLSQRDFEAYARELLKSDPILINLVAREVNGGEQLSFPGTSPPLPMQPALIDKVLNSGQILVSPPQQLSQGKLGFIGHAPVYVGDSYNRQLWGFISAPMDTALLYRNAKIEDSNTDYRLSIKSFDPMGNESPTFFGDPEVFNQPKAIQTSIKVGAGYWTIALVNQNPEENLHNNLSLVRVISWSSCLLVCAFAFFRFRQDGIRRELETKVLTNQNLLQAVGNVAKIGGWKINEAGEFIQWSDQAAVLIGKNAGYQPDSLDAFTGLLSEKDLEYWRQHIRQAFAESRSFDIELKVNSELQGQVWLQIIGHANYEDGQVLVTGTLQDVSDRVLSAKLIERQATYDALTNLPNRVLFNDRLIRAIENAQRNRTEVAVLFIDLDRFKPVNDNHGHQTGDKLLVNAARRIQPCIRESDTVARLSGDEFGVILVNIRNASDALKVIEQIYSTMQRTYAIDNVRLHCSASIGAAFFPGDGRDAEALLRKADQAMYEVKSTGRNGWQFYTSQMQQKSEYRHKLLNEFIVAINENKIQTYYQPIVDLESNQITRCESLARWVGESGDYIPPKDFIEIAEETGLVNKVDLIMLKNSAKSLPKFTPLDGDIELSINVSPRLFHTKDKALEKWLRKIKQYSQSMRITVEITERLLIDDADKALSVLKRLKSYGVKIAIDDFGTGYSSLSYLVKFPVDIIKIDRGFVDAIGVESSAETLIQTILLMAKKLAIQVVAEGIETSLQYQFLKKHQCDYGQGFYFGHPMNESEFAEFLSGKSNQHNHLHSRLLNR